MKKRYFILILILFFNTIFLSADEKISLISVTGRGEIKVVPDTVVFHLLSQTDDKNLNKAKNDNDKLTASLISTIKKYIADEKDIQTGQIRIEPRYEKTYEEKGFAGFFITRDIVFELRDLKKFEDLLSNLIKEGADRIQGIYFKTSKEKELLSQARILAVKDAKNKAQEIAQELNQKIGKAIRVSENTVYQPQQLNLKMQILSAERSSQGTFEPGQILISAEVFCEFELK